MTLENCPFCGSDAVYSSLDCTCIFCDDCGALGPVCVDRNPEILWNKRAESDDIPEWLATEINEIINQQYRIGFKNFRLCNKALELVLSLKKDVS
jgi:hypothetical protein